MDERIDSGVYYRRTCVRVRRCVDEEAIAKSYFWRNCNAGNSVGSAEPVSVYYRWRPSSPDPSDEFVVDCVMNANAVLVTSNVKDFRQAEYSLSLNVMTPVQLLEYLIE